jgi:hypothetical protein
VGKKHGSYGNSAKHYKGGNNYILGTNATSSVLFVPVLRATDKITLGKHPLLIALHAQGAIVDKEDEIRALSVSSFKSLKIGFLGRYFAHIAIQTQVHSHSTSLHSNLRQTGNHVMDKTNQADESPRPLKVENQDKIQCEWEGPTVSSGSFQYVIQAYA